MEYYSNRLSAEIMAEISRIDVLLLKFGINIEDLSPQADRLLSKMAMYQKIMDLKNLDETNVNLWYTDTVSTSMKYEEYTLLLRHDIKQRERENSKHRKELEKFQKDLNLVKNTMEKLPSSEMIQKEISILQSKVASYEQNLLQGKMKLSRLNIKPEITPESLKVLIDELAMLKVERDQLKGTAENITMVRAAKKDLMKLKNVSLESEK